MHLSLRVVSLRLATSLHLLSRNVDDSAKVEKTRLNLFCLFPKTAEKFHILELKTKRKKCVESPPRVVELLSCEIHFYCNAAASQHPNVCRSR